MPIPVTVLITVGCSAELVTPRHPATAPLILPAAQVAAEVGIPANELPGKALTAEWVTGDDAGGFAWPGDPRG